MQFNQVKMKEMLQKSKFRIVIDSLNKRKKFLISKTNINTKQYNLKYILINFYIVMGIKNALYVILNIACIQPVHC